MPRIRVGWVSVALGFVMLLLAAHTIPLGHPPLYDGVVIEDPYRYLEPPAGKPGKPTAVSDTLALDQGVSPQLYSGTLENPPQAQMIADRDAFQLPPGTTSIRVSIQPVKPPGPVPSGHVSGNVYRFKVTNQAGTDLSLRPGTTITIVVRAPNGVTDGRLARFDGSAWVALPTENGGLPDIYATNPMQLGDFAVLATGSATPIPSGSPGPGLSAAPSPAPAPAPGGGGQTPWVVIGLVAAAVLVGVLWRTLGEREP